MHMARTRRAIMRGVCGPCACAHARFYARGQRANQKSAMLNAFFMLTLVACNAAAIMVCVCSLSWRAIDSLAAASTPRASVSRVARVTSAGSIGSTSAAIASSSSSTSRAAAPRVSLSPRRAICSSVAKISSWPAAATVCL